MRKYDVWRDCLVDNENYAPFTSMCQYKNIAPFEMEKWMNFEGNIKLKMMILKNYEKNSLCLLQMCGNYQLFLESLQRMKNSSKKNNYERARLYWDFKSFYNFSIIALQTTSRNNKQVDPFASGNDLFRLVPPSFRSSETNSIALSDKVLFTLSPSFEKVPLNAIEEKSMFDIPNDLSNIHFYRWKDKNNAS